MVTSRIGEIQRVLALRQLELMDTPSEDRFDRLTRLAAEVTGAPISLITLVDDSRTWAKSCFGIDQVSLGCDGTFCQLVVQTNAPLLVEDTRLDPRFADACLHSGGPPVRFYAGYPLHAPGGEAIGAMSVVAYDPRTLAPERAALLQDLVRLAEEALQARVRASEAARTLDKLDEVERLKSDFLNAASHELRTPLAAIVGYSEFLEDDIAGELNPAQREFVAQLQAGAGRLTHLIDDLLDFARLEAGSFRIAPRDTRLDVLVLAELEALASAARQAGIELSAQIPPGDWVLEIDPGPISQGVRHLLDNALKFTPTGGRVVLGLAREGQVVTLAVEDTGVGIASEHLPHLFNKFYQVDPSPTRSHGGAGLGLALCRAVALAHGGHVGVESTVGRGSRFWLTLESKRH